MKTCLKLLLILSFFSGCADNHESSPESAAKSDSADVNLLPDSSTAEPGDGAAQSNSPADEATENARLAMANLLTAKKEMSELRNDMRDSLSKSGLAQEQRLLFSQAIRDLDQSTRSLNRQIEQIVVSDLQQSRTKLGGIVQEMKKSEKQLGGMIERLDRISNYLQVATTLLQSVVPLPAPKGPAR